MVHVASRKDGVLHHLANRFVRRASELDRSDAICSVVDRVCVVVEQKANETLVVIDDRVVERRLAILALLVDGG